MTSKVRNVSGGGRFLVKAAGVVASVALALGIGLATPCTAQAIDLAAPEHSKTISSNDDGPTRCPWTSRAARAPRARP